MNEVTNKRGYTMKLGTFETVYFAGDAIISRLRRVQVRLR